ncbi:MAG: ATP-binding cassette domain-containing protein [Pseudolabrys sp.]
MKFRAGVTRMIADGVTKSFGQVVAIEDVGFKVEEHEFLAVLGPSGSGKTTLFRCLTGLLLPDRGTVRIDDHDVTTLRGGSRRRIAVVFQQFNLVNRLTAFQNVLAGRLGHVPAWRGLTRRFNRTDKLLALECLSRVGLLAQASQRADTLSGGQQQRVAIARALASRSRVSIRIPRRAYSTYFGVLPDPRASPGAVCAQLCRSHRRALARPREIRSIGCEV